MIRISEADYGAAMSDHQKYIREAERLGPIWHDLRQRKAQAVPRASRTHPRICAGSAARFDRILHIDITASPESRRTSIGAISQNQDHHRQRKRARQLPRPFFSSTHDVTTHD